MQIIIPMSGFGERFRRAGYKIPKPLIEVDNKPIIQYVIEMFPNEDNFIFICNENHLNNPHYNMAQILREICPTGKIIPISEHKFGPVYAVLKATESIDMDQPTIVNYCDFTCYWDYKDFKNFTILNDCDGAIPSYRFFHPHTIWSNNYAYLKEENRRISDIQEKKPFTNNSLEEFASSGTYYFKSAQLMKDYFEKTIELKLMVSDEYYVSMPYKPMIDDGLKILVYELNYFMQWGTPQDLEEYLYWSKLFKNIMHKKPAPKQDGNVLLPMVGEGSRFKERGYETPKPLIKVSGKPMALQALSDLPRSDEQRFVLRKDLEDIKILEKELSDTPNNPSISILESLTDGQATTCIEGSTGLDPMKPITIAACDNGMNYDSALFEGLMKDDSVDIILWGARGYPGSIRAPEKYGWIEANETNSIVSNVSVKTPLSNPKEDLIIVGAFTFKKLVDFKDAVKSMKSRKALINNEYYIDTAINDAIAMGKKCKILEIEDYICWGSPNDLKTFEYWQSCFHQWHSHPYRLEKDPYIEKSSLTDIKEYYSSIWDNRNNI